MEEPLTADPVLHFATQIVQIINSFGFTGILIVGGILWYKMGMPGFKRSQSVSTEGGEEACGEYIQSPVPAMMPNMAPPIDMEKVERKIDSLGRKVDAYRDEVRRAIHEHEQDDTKQFKTIAFQLGQIQGKLGIEG